MNTPRLGVTAVSTDA